MRVSRDGEQWHDAPWSDQDYDEWLAERNEDRAVAGLQPLPTRMLWLLRPPPGFATVEESLEPLSQLIAAADFRQSPQLTALLRHAAEELFAS
jgi:hypothetical protein